MISLRKLKRQITAGVATACAVASMPISAFAATTVDSVQIETGLDAVDVVGNILGYLLMAAQLVGGGVLIYAFISFALSIAQENPDQRSRAIMFIVAGAMLVGIKPILDAVGVIK